MSQSLVTALLVAAVVTLVLLAQFSVMAAGNGRRQTAFGLALPLVFLALVAILLLGK